MIDLEIVSHARRHKIYISKLKYFYIKDYNSRRSIINAIDAVFLKEKDSEYAIEKNVSSKLLSDGKQINVNDFEYYKITDSFDIKNEMKLGVKTLFLKYLETKTSKLEYSENYQALQYILADLEEDIAEIISFDFNSLDFHIHINLEKKQILKLIVPEMVKESLSTNSLDISYDELIELQFQFLLAIAKEAEKKLIVTIDIPNFKKSWIHLIELFPENTYFLLFNTKIPCNIDYKKLFICYNSIEVDLYDENGIYDLCMIENKNYTIDEYRTFLINQLDKE